MRARAREARDRLAKLPVPDRFASDHQRLVAALEPTEEGAQEERLQVRAERRIEAQGLWERMRASANTDDERRYATAVGAELDRRHAEALRMYDEWERLTNKFIRQLSGMSVPPAYTAVMGGLTEVLHAFLGQTVRLRAALAERDYMKLAAEAVEWSSVNARLGQLRQDFLEKSPLKKD
jgi:hypothetical protein